MTKSPSDPPLWWLAELASVAAKLPEVQRPRPYYSQRELGAQQAPESSLPSIVHRVRSLIGELDRDHYFADAVGFDCCDGNGESDSSPEQELERRVGKPHLWTADPDGWTEADLCDFIEVFHDLAARPTKGWYHSYSGCGWHPTKFSRKSGQALYRWRTNQLLDATMLSLRLADSGEDAGRMVRVAPGELGQLINDMIVQPSSAHDAVVHAIAMFRSRTGTTEQHRSAIVALAGVLEARRALLKNRLLRKDEDALFEIANNYHLRHHTADQRTDYSPDFLEWIFYWYLATVQLSDRLLAEQSR
ncbi:MAG: hypothetical protein ACYC1D_11485 [Acidimicrobiales bacterium]